jgi:acetylornithine aminotransferase
MTSHLMNTYGRQAISFTHGQGVWLFDAEGKRYLDALAGVAVNGLGHAHPRLVEDLQAQIATLIHCSNIYEIPLQNAAATQIAELSQMDKVFFCNSGAEANEALIKLARLHGNKKGIQQAKIIVTEKSFHGRTLATLSATGNAKIQAGFAPLVEGFVRVPYNDIAAIEALKEDPNIVAILAEPIQGEGGINVPAHAYLQSLRALCDKQGWLLMLDEVQTGIGRTGTWFAHQHAQIIPDAMALAKGLGSGVAVGACVAKGAAAELFTPGSHGSTFGGNPLACRAVLSTLHIMQTEKLLENAVTMGDYLRQEFKTALHDLPAVVDIRGIGLMIGIELDRPCVHLVKAALEAGLLINVTADKVIRLVPPLIINRSEADFLVLTLSQLIRTFLA